MLRKKSVYRRITIAAGSMAAAVAFTLTLVAFNPKLAEAIPIVGKIFAQVEDRVTFTGDYSSKAEAIAQHENGNESGNVVNSAEDQGITLSVSEAYSDGASVYLTFEVNNTASFGEIQSYYTSSYGESAANLLYLEGEWSIRGRSGKIPLSNVHLEGTQTSEHSFIGMAKFDISTLADIPDFFDFQLDIHNIAADQVLAAYPEDSILPTYRTDGLWSLSIPLHADKEAVKTVELNTADNAYGIRKVIATPYELKIDVTDKTASLNGGDYGISVFDQDGNRLQFEYMEGNTITYSLKRANVSSIEILINKDFIASMKNNNKEELAASAIYQTVLDLSDISHP